MNQRRTTSGSLLAGVTMLLAGTLAAQAAPAAIDRNPAKVANAVQVSPVAAVDGEDEAANCSTTRKRLWVESEGWVVRKVTICR